MADQPRKRSPTPPRPTSEDPDTAEARIELKQTAISEKKPDLSSSTSSIMSAKTKSPAAAAATTTAEAAGAAEAAEATGAGDAATSQPEKAPSKATTPERDPHDTQSFKRETISSPKKKRAHDQVDDVNQSGQDPDGDVSPIGANGAASASRTERSEPEKKRPRDVSSEAKKVNDDAKEFAVGSTL